MSGASNSGMSGRFNPYKTWLGLDVSGRKPTHYELLGLAPGAIDAGKVRVLAQECSAKVKAHQTGPNAELATQLLNEIIAAEWVLEDLNRKAKYDASLTESRMAQADVPEPTKTIASPPDHKTGSKDPEKVVKVHSVQMSIDAATGYGLKEPEEKGKQAGFDWAKANASNVQSKQHWQLFWYAIAAASSLSIGIGSLALWSALSIPLDPNRGYGFVKPEPGFAEDSNKPKLASVDANAINYESPGFTKANTEAPFPKVKSAGDIDRGGRVGNQGMEELGGTLFNGMDLAGWSPVTYQLTKNKDANTWSFDPLNGIIASSGVDFLDIASDKSYLDFDITFQWRFTPGTIPQPNGSGVVVRARGLTSTSRDPRGIEIDLRPRETETTGMTIGRGSLIAYETKLTNRFGSVDGMIPGPKRNLGIIKKIPPAQEGEWTNCQIHCQKDKIFVYMNGELVNKAWGADESGGKIVLRSQNTAVQFKKFKFTEFRPEN